jgi:hypothetical protein
MGVKLDLTPSDEDTHSEFESRLLKILQPKTQEEVAQRCRKLYSEEICNLNFPLSIFRAIYL